MTTPERGLFDEITEAGRKHNWRMEWEILKPITDKFEQRLAEAEDYIGRLPANWDKNSSLETWFPFTAEEVKRDKETIAQLRARCGELEGLLAEQRKFIEIVYKGSKSGNRNYPIGHTNDEWAERLLAVPQPAQEQK